MLKRMWKMCGIALLALSLCGFAPLAGCEEDAGDQMEDAGEELEDAAEEGQEAAEQTGEQIQEGVENATDNSGSQ